MGWFMPGGGSLPTGLYFPSSKEYCELPSLPIERYRHSVTDFTVCGGQPKGGQNVVNPDSVQTDCITFNTSNGQWEKSYDLGQTIFEHVAWKISKGILLLGGGSLKTTLLLPGGGTEAGPFDLTRVSRYSCGIEDPNSKTIILTGGTKSSSVERYSETGFRESLPNMNTERVAHGCAGYYNDAGYLVSLSIFVF